MNIAEDGICYEYEYEYFQEEIKEFQIFKEEERERSGPVWTEETSKEQ